MNFLKGLLVALLFVVFLYFWCLITPHPVDVYGDAAPYPESWRGPSCRWQRLSWLSIIGAFALAQGDVTDAGWSDYFKSTLLQVAVSIYSFLFAAACTHVYLKHAVPYGWRVDSTEAVAVVSWCGALGTLALVASIVTWLHPEHQDVRGKKLLSYDEAKQMLRNLERDP